MNNANVALSTLLMLILSVAGVVALLQIIIVPTMAKRRGRDPGVWFMITVIWLFFSTILTVIAWFAMLGAILLPVFGGQWGSLYGLGCLLVSIIILNLPLIALMMSSRRGWAGPREQPYRTRRYPRRRYRR